MREKFIKFMEGRYGVDAFAKFTMGFAFGGNHSVYVYTESSGCSV